MSSASEDQGKTEKALKILDDALLKYQDKTYDRYALLSIKFELLSNSSRYQEALEAAIEKANIVTSPRQALNVAQVFLKMGDPEHALEWLEASVERGLQSYAILEDDTYRPLRDNPRFRSLAETVKSRETGWDCCWCSLGIHRRHPSGSSQDRQGASARRRC